MLTPDEVVDVTRDLWKRHEAELLHMDRINGFANGWLGVPEVPEGAGDELKDLARMSVKNVLSLVRDAFAQSLSVTGLRSPDSTDNAAAWDIWQELKMDARQAAIHRPCVTFGASYAVGLSDEVRIRTPRQLFAAYEDPHVDDWPIYALETWIDRSEAKPARMAVLYDDEFMYPMKLGQSQVLVGASRRDQERADRARVIRPEQIGDAVRHGASYCPVVRYVNARDAEDSVLGEVEPLIPQQKAINAVNFDRLTVSRFGAHPQKYAIGWQAAGPDELARLSAARLLAFDDDGVKVGSFAQASMQPYNSLLEEMVAHVAITAQIPPTLLSPMANLSAEAIAMAEAPYQRKLAEKRESLGESHEQLIRHLASLRGVEVPDDVEVVWRDTEARSFGAVVDGITKLASVGVPIETLLDDVPGWSGQRVEAARSALRRNRGQAVIEALRSQAPRELTSGDAGQPEG